MSVRIDGNHWVDNWSSAGAAQAEPAQDKAFASAGAEIAQPVRELAPRATAVNDLSVARLKQSVQSKAGTSRRGSVKWGSLSRSRSVHHKHKKPVADSPSPLDPEQLRAVAGKFTESQEQANAILATPEGRAQVAEIRKLILLDQEEPIFGPQGSFPGWEAKQRLIFLEPDHVDQIRMAADDDTIQRLPGAKLAHLITDLAGSEDPQAAARSEQARGQLAALAMRFVQSQQDADAILADADGARSVDAMKYLILHHQETAVLGPESAALGWEAKQRLIFFKPHDVERIRMLNDQVAIDEYDEVKRERALLDGAQLVSAPRPSQGNYGEVVSELLDLLFKVPGQKVGIFGTKVGDGRGIDDLRRKEFPEEYTQRPDGSLELQSAPFASDPQGGHFDPYQFLPNIVFQNGEDSLPVDPVFDGDAWPDNNALNYAHGAIGGRQPLKAAVNVYQKDGYYVAQYGFYYPDNKGGDYHQHDWHTTAVYFKYNQGTGNFEPQYLYNSWHFGGVMTRWSDLNLDAQGRPTVMVGLGTHAARPLGRGQSLPDSFTNGLTLRGSDGEAIDTASGQTLGERLTFFTTQDNIDDATLFDPTGSDIERTRAGIYYWWQDHRRNPYPPSLFGLQ